MRGQLTKIDVEAFLYRMKNEIYHDHPDKSGEWHKGAHYSLNEMLEYLKRYRL